jgi:hypothetical protein
LLPYDYEDYRYSPAYNMPMASGSPQHDPATKPKCEPKPLISNCKNLSGVATIPIINITAAAPVQRTLGTISADLHCFRKPCVKLDLSTLIIIGLATDVPFTVTFRIFKRCDNQPEMEINSFDVSVVNPVAAGTSIPINLNVCDCCDNCPGKCCTYRIAAEGTALAAITDYFSVNQAVLSILASDSC